MASKPTDGALPADGHSPSSLGEGSQDEPSPIMPKRTPSIHRDLRRRRGSNNNGTPPVAGHPRAREAAASSSNAEQREPFAASQDGADDADLAAVSSVMRASTDPPQVPALRPDAVSICDVVSIDDAAAAAPFTGSLNGSFAGATMHPDDYGGTVHVDETGQPLFPAAERMSIHEMLAARHKRLEEEAAMMQTTSGALGSNPASPDHLNASFSGGLRRTVSVPLRPSARLAAATRRRWFESHARCVVWTRRSS